MPEELNFAVLLKIKHPGIEKTVWFAKQRMHCPGLENDIKEGMESYERCIRSKTFRPWAELCPITSNRLLDILCIDILFLKELQRVLENVLVMTDHFTRYAGVVPCKN